MSSPNKFLHKIQKLRAQKKDISDLIDAGNISAAKNLLYQYKASYENDYDINNYETVILILEQKIEEAGNKCREVIEKRPFNFTAHYNMAKIKTIRGETIDVLDYYMKAWEYSDDSQQRSIILDELEAYLGSFQLELLEDEFRSLLEKKVANINKRINHINNKQIYFKNKHFPFKGSNDACINLLATNIFEHYYVGNFNISNTSINDSRFTDIETEIIKDCTEVTEITFDIKQDCMIPMAVNAPCSIEATFNSNAYKFSSFKTNKVNYVSFKEKGEVKLQSEDKFVVGKPIPLKDTNKEKLVLCIFADGLSASILEDNGFLEVMPNTYKFFRNGTRCTNFNTNGEWTLPSISNIFTGNYTTNHNLYHPDLDYELGKDGKLISNLFEKAGYLTYQNCSNDKKSPAYGFVKGFNRTHYQNSMLGQKSVPTVISEVIDHLQAFDKRSNFVWMTLFSLHNKVDDLRMSIGSQLKDSIYAKTLKRSVVKSVNQEKDDRKIEKYINEIQVMDFYLGFLYDFINENYDDNEIVVNLFADHGQSFLSEDPYFVSEKRIQVPWLLRGKNIPIGNCNEKIEAVDIFPTLLKLCDIELDSKIDGQVPRWFGGNKEREFTYTESIYPNKTYKALIMDDVHKFTFMTKNNMTNDGTVEISQPGDYSVALINRTTNLDEQKDFKDKVEKYIMTVFEHISRNLII